MALVLFFLYCWALDHDLHFPFRPDPFPAPDPPPGHVSCHPPYHFLIVLAIPLLTLIIPLIRVLPPVYRWRMRAKVNRLYASLARLEAGFGTGSVAAAEALSELDRIETEAEALELPAAYVSELYELRFYLERVRALILEPEVAADTAQT